MPVLEVTKSNQQRLSSELMVTSGRLRSAIDVMATAVAPHLEVTGSSSHLHSLLF